MKSQKKIKNPLETDTTKMSQNQEVQKIYPRIRTTKRSPQNKGQQNENGDHGPQSPRLNDNHAHHRPGKIQSIQSGKQKGVKITQNGQKQN